MLSLLVPASSPEGRIIDFQLADVLHLLKPRSEESRWLCSGVECLGPGAEELMEYAAFRAPIPGSELLRLACMIDQVLSGVFEACEGEEEKPWLKIRIVPGRKFEFFAVNRRVLEKISSFFSSAAAE